MTQTSTAPSLLRITTAGSVDDGKSTLIGRLLYESKAILDDQLEALQKSRNSDGGLDLSLVTDGLKSEREQGITIDVAYKYFSSAQRKYILADAPGHLQYTRNLVTAASRADVAIILVDASQGVLEQTRRHAYLVHLLAIPHVILAINKIDRIDYDESRIAAIEQSFRELSWNHGHPSLHSIPLSALRGDNISIRSSLTPWYRGPTLLELLDALPLPRLADAAFALPIQLVGRERSGQRFAAGTLQRGTLQRGDAVRILPGAQQSVIETLWVHGELKPSAKAGEAIALRLADERDLERGSLLVPLDHELPAARQLRAHLVWFDAEPLRLDERYILRLGSQSSRATILQIEYRFDLEQLTEVAANTLQMNDIACVALQSSRPLLAAAFVEDRNAGAFILIDPASFRTVAAGMIIDLAQIGDAPTLEGRLLAVTKWEQPAPEARTLQLPRAFLQLNASPRQLQALELLLEQGWTLEIETSPEAQRLSRTLGRQGGGAFEDGLGI